MITEVMLTFTLKDSTHNRIKNKTNDNEKAFKKLIHQFISYLVSYRFNISKFKVIKLKQQLQESNIKHDADVNFLT